MSMIRKLNWKIHFFVLSELQHGGLILIPVYAHKIFALLLFSSIYYYEEMKKKSEENEMMRFTLCIIQQAEASESSGTEGRRHKWVNECIDLIYDSLWAYIILPIHYMHISLYWHAARLLANPAVFAKIIVLARFLYIFFEINETKIDRRFLETYSGRALSHDSTQQYY